MRPRGQVSECAIEQAQIAHVHAPKKHLDRLPGRYLLQQFRDRIRLRASPPKPRALIPETGVLFEQLRDLFTQTNWTIDAVSIGTVGVVGKAFPAGSYMTSADIAAPLVRSVFAAFSDVGVDLPLVPDAFAGPTTDTTAQVVIVLH
mgnify:CR=1 FL=1